nr:MAG TPA: Baseplate wedge protein [Bacteriophage sp.]
MKKLTYKWDPSISNESDPGVILLKLNAIIADKNNYNIDKNILETFPLSVT